MGEAKRGFIAGDRVAGGGENRVPYAPGDLVGLFARARADQPGEAPGASRRVTGGFSANFNTAHISAGAAA